MVNVSNPGETRNNFIFWMWFQSKQSIPDSIFFEWSCFTSLEVSFFLFTHVTCRRCQHYFLLFFKAFPNSVDLGIVQNHDNDELPKLIGCKANRQRPVTCLKAPFRVEKISPLNVTLKNEFPKQILPQDIIQDMSLLGFQFHDQVLGVYCFR